MKPRWLLAIAVLACLWTTEAPAGACSCGESSPPCQATWEAAAVFVGEVLSVQDGDPPPDRRGIIDGSRQVTFRVLEGFRGVSTSRVLVFTDGNRSSCGMDFQKGATYLVYAARFMEGSLYTHMCSRTKPVAAASADLEYLRGPARVPSGLGVVEGVARQPDLREKEYFAFDEEPPFAGGRVVVESIEATPPARYEGRTGLDGRYAVRVPVGKYRLRMEVRDGLWVQPMFYSTPEVRDPRGCYRADFSVAPDGRISGRVIAADGRPVPGLSVEALRSGDSTQGSYWSNLRARTDAAGIFEFVRLLPQEYVIGLTLHKPSDKDSSAIWFGAGNVTKRAIPVAPEQRVWAGEFTLPESIPLAAITGTVMGPAGKSAAGLRVSIITSDGNDIVAGPVPVGAAGTFAFTVVAGRSYRVLAEQSGDPPADRKQVRTDVFTATGPMSFVVRFEK